MKPIVVYLDKESIDKNIVTMTRKEFEELLQNVYNQGYSDGSSYKYWCTYSNTPYLNTSSTSSVTASQITKITNSNENDLPKRLDELISYEKSGSCE